MIDAIVFITLAIIIAIIVHSVSQSNSMADQQLSANIEARKREALDKNIFILASKVVLQWGKAAEGGLSFAKDQLEIFLISDKERGVKMSISADGSLVFEGYSSVEKGYSYVEPRVKIERVGESFELVKEYGTKDRATWTVESYIPGKWVKDLQRLQQKADAESIEKRKAKEQQLAQEKAQAERHKFGL